VARACGVAGYALSDPRAMRRRPARSAGHTGPGPDRSRRRPERTSAAAESHVRAGQKSMEALARGTPDAGQIARNIALGKIRELI
jgi:hypothetical protein